MANKDRPIIIKKIKKVQAHGHHGGAWKIAYADFVTAMMAFFLLMWLLAVADKETKRGLSDYFNNPPVRLSLSWKNRTTRSPPRLTRFPRSSPTRGNCCLI